MTTQKRTNGLLNFSVMVIISMTLAGSAMAATITWTAHDITDNVNGLGDSTDVSTNGVLVEARNGATSDRIDEAIAAIKSGEPKELIRLVF